MGRGKGDLTVAGLPRSILRRLRRATLGAREATKNLTAFWVQPHPSPIFVVGNQKSGTTAIAALLARMTGLRATLDLRREIRSPTFHHVHTRECSLEEFIARNRLDFSKELIKEPNLALLCDPLRARFPAARFVFVVRNPRDCIRSILDRLALPGNLPELPPGRMAALTEAWRLVVDGRWLGLDGAHYIDLLAQRWNLIAEVYLKDPAGFVLCRYEDFGVTRLAR